MEWGCTKRKLTDIGLCGFIEYWKQILRTVISGHWMVCLRLLILVNQLLNQK